jgi:hypothetical protein
MNWAIIETDHKGSQEADMSVHMVIELRDREGA